MIYTLNSFNPEYAGDIAKTAYGVMFDYNEPDFLAPITAINGGCEPMDTTIILSNRGISLQVWFYDGEGVNLRDGYKGEDIKPQDCFFVVDYHAGRHMVSWLWSTAFGATPIKIAAISQRILLALAYEPTERGGVSLWSLSKEEQEELCEAYKFVNT